MPASPLTPADNIDPADHRLSLYLGTRYMTRLQAALQHVGLPTRYARPGAHGIDRPCLYVHHPVHDVPLEAICVKPWFEWQRAGELICPAIDIPKAAQLIAEQLSFRA